MTSLLFVSGSLRAGSVNSAAVRAARRFAAAHPAVHHTARLTIGRIPFYNGDIEATCTPRAVARARSAVQAADVMIISTPAYNGAPPGVLKNALDWLSRPGGASVLQGKRVATLSASPGRLGGLDAQESLRTVLTRCGCVLVGPDPLVAIADAGNRCGRSGELTDPDALDAIRELVAASVAALHPEGALQ